MKRLKKKLGSRSGETILEVLVAFMIVTVITAALVQSIVVSNRINKSMKSQGLDRNLMYAENLSTYTGGVDVNKSGEKTTKKSITYVTTSDVKINGTARSSFTILSNRAGVYLKAIMWDDTKKGIYYSFEGPRS